MAKRSKAHGGIQGAIVGNVFGTGEDRTVLPHVARQQLDKHYETPSIQDMLQYFNGSKQELAEKLSGTTDKKSRAYKNARDDINRWLRDPSKKSARKIGKETKAKFDVLIDPKDKANFTRNPSHDMHITIHGMIGYAGNIRIRTLSFSIGKEMFNQIMQKAVDNPSGAYRDLMSIYFEVPVGSETPITVYSDPPPIITFS